MNDSCENVVNRYLRNPDGITVSEFDNSGSPFVEGARVVLGKILNQFPITTADSILLMFELEFSQIFEFHLNIHVKTIDQIHLFQASCDSFISDINHKYIVEYEIPAHLLNERFYSVSISMVKNQTSTFFSQDGVLNFSVVLSKEDNILKWFGTTPGMLRPKIQSNIKYKV